MIKQYFFVIALFLIGSSGSSQNIISMLDVNDLDLRIRSNGQLSPSVVDGALTVPSALGSGQNLMWGGGLWISGMDEAGDMHVSAHYYGAAGHDMYPGPLTNDGLASITPETILEYDRIWRVNRYEVQLHAFYFDCLNDPSCDLAMEFPDGYTTPPSLLNWPAHGDLDNGQAFHLAPWNDSNADGYYDAMVGDYPCVPGDLALFMIYNDVGGPHVETGGEPLGIEVHMTAFGYYGDQDLRNTVFIHYKLINRSTSTYNDVHISNFSDLEIGCSNDDLIGTDVQRNMVYAYNGDDVDEDCLGTAGFGEEPPAVGVIILKGPLLSPDGTDDAAGNSLPAYTGSGFGDGIIDNERHGLSRSMYFQREGNTATTGPALSDHFRQYQRGIWKNGVPFTYGGNGYSESSGTIPAAFAYPGSSDPLGAGTSGVPQPSWAATLEGNIVDPKIVATMGPITLDPGSEHEILIAYVFAGSEGGAAASIAELQARVDSITAFAQNIPGIMGEGSSCDQLGVGLLQIDRGNDLLLLYPNPATDELFIDVQTSSLIEIFDARGVLIMKQQTTNTRASLDIRSLQFGSYFIRLVHKDAVLVGRFVKE
ncbi:MAG: T9SS type A sorting domain-containing protein [Bacteroidota bacterium]|nr:T9SS type A sorting domain-containing protein [Bacteroidota bacterium]